MSFSWLFSSYYKTKAEIEFNLDNTVFEKPANFGQTWINLAGKRPLLKLGFNYQLHTATFLRMSIGEGYRFPTMGELFVKTQIGPLAIYPNKKLTIVGISKPDTIFFKKYPNQINFIDKGVIGLTLPEWLNIVQ